MNELRAGERVELRVESLAATGEGVARHAGRVVFVPQTAPGDRVLAEIGRVRRRHAHADLVRVLEAGPGRREPPCLHAGNCGGCDWMHLDEKVQEEGRCRTVEDALRRLGGLGTLPALEEITSPATLGYRARARVTLDHAPSARGSRAGVRVGFHAARSHDVVDVSRCAVLDPPTQTALERLRAEPPDRPGDVEIRGFEREVEVGPYRYRVSPGSFFQANRSLWREWLETVHGACGRGALAVELYAGVGFYTVGLAGRYERVIAVERGRSALDLAHNAPEVEVVHTSAEAFAELTLPGLSPDLALVNPPREGCHPSVVAALADVARVVYVSCDAATLARDVARLSSTHRPTRLVLLHALPQTSHVEVVLVVERVDTSSR